MSLVSPSSAELADLNEIDEVELVASIVRESFYHFVKEFWYAINREELIDNWHIKYLCDLAQGGSERVFQGLPRLADEIINVPPGSTKSTIFSVMLTPWCWSRMPHLRSINGSHTHELVLDLSRKSRDVIQSPLYRACFPYIKLRSDQNTKGYFVNNFGGTRFCATVGGKNPMGMHAHILSIDDPIDPKQAKSDAEIKTANEFIIETANQRRIDQQVSLLFLIMQRLAQNDPTGNRMKYAARDYNLTCLPAEITPDLCPPSLRSRYTDGLLDPVRLPRVVLDAKKRLGDYLYAGQYLQRPVPAGGGMNKIGRIQVIEQEPPLTFFDLVVRFWDKAATPDGGCRTAGVKMGRRKVGMTAEVPAGKGYARIPAEPIYDYYILHVATGQWGTDEREARIKQTAEMDGRKVKVGLEEEGGSSGKDSSSWTTQRLAGYDVVAERPTGDKTERHRPFSSQVNSGRVWMVKGEWNIRLLDELEFFPFSEFKDQADACSGAFKILTAPQIRAGGLGGFKKDEYSY